MVATLGVERDGDGGVIVCDRNAEPVGVWSATVWDGEQEFNEHGRCITPALFTMTRRNLITTVGKGLILDRVFGLSSVIAVAGLAVGTSATAAAVGDTAITGAVYKPFDTTPTRSGLTVTGTTSYLTSEANISIQEAGALTASGGTLLNHVAPFLQFTKTSAVALSVTLTLTQS